MDWVEVVPYLSGQAHIATVRPDGHPHVAKVWPAVERTTIWVATRANSRKAKNLADNPHAALMFEPRAEAYVSVTAEIVPDADIKRRLWDSGVFPYAMEGFWGSPDNDDWVLLRLTPTDAVVMLQGESGLRRERWRA